MRIGLAWEAASEECRLHGVEVAGREQFEAELAFAPLDGKSCLSASAAAQYRPGGRSSRLDSGLFEEQAFNRRVLLGSLFLVGHEIPEIEAKAEGVLSKKTEIHVFQTNEAADEEPGTDHEYHGERHFSTD